MMNEYPLTVVTSIIMNCDDVQIICSSVLKFIVIKIRNFIYLLFIGILPIIIVMKFRSNSKMYYTYIIGI